MSESNSYLGLKFVSYEQLAGETAMYPERGAGSIAGISYAVLGLNGEAGEVAEKVKKLIRDQGGVMTDEFKAAVKKELGDVLWYLTATAHELGISLEDVAISNLDKLQSRKIKGTLHGNGDNR